MIDIRYNAPNILRLYIWDLVKNNVAGQGVINGLIPIVPLEDEPDLADSGKSYFIYGYTENYRNNFPIRNGAFSLRIVGRDFNELSHITNVLNVAFEDCDLAAANVNSWSSDFAPADLKGITFTSVELAYVDGGSPGEAEGAKSEGIVTLNYEYKNLQTVKRFRPAGTKYISGGTKANPVYSTSVNDEWL